MSSRVSSTSVSVQAPYVIAIGAQPLTEAEQRRRHSATQRTCHPAPKRSASRWAERATALCSRPPCPIVAPLLPVTLSALCTCPALLPSCSPLLQTAPDSPDSAQTARGSAERRARRSRPLATALALALRLLPNLALPYPAVPCLTACPARPAFSSPLPVPVKPPQEKSPSLLSPLPQPDPV